MATEQMTPAKPAAWFATVPPEEILPVVDDRFESSVPGIYVVGDATGTPLVRIAANQGARAVRQMIDDGIFRATEQTEEVQAELDLLIIGAGPAGLAAALEAHQCGLRYVVVERGCIASTIDAFPPGKTVYAEPRGVRNESALEFDQDLDRDEFLRRIRETVGTHGLHIRENCEVAGIRRTGDRRFAVETAAGRTFPAANVLIAIGRQGQPRELTCPGSENRDRVSYRVHSARDYAGQNVLIVGGGNSAIEAALLLSADAQVTLSYRGSDFFRAKDSNRQLLLQAEQSGAVQVLRNSSLDEVRTSSVLLTIDGRSHSLPNDKVVALIGNLPPVGFLLEAGVELDGLWTRRRLVAALTGLAVGLLIYFGAKHVVLEPSAAGPGRLLVPGLASIAEGRIWQIGDFLLQSILPAFLLTLLALVLINRNRTARRLSRFLPAFPAGRLLATGSVACAAAYAASQILTVDPAAAGPGPYHIAGLGWLYHFIPDYFASASGLYYLLYFMAITGFGLYWARRSGHSLIWRRNLTIIATQWTLWWGIPTLLAVCLGRNPWTPLISRSLNAWPLNMAAFRLDPAVGPGDPAWWHTVAVAGVVWAIVLTFVVIPLVTIRWGKVYCSYFCSCGALAETVGNGFRHRGPKGDLPRRLERFGFVFIPLAAVATAADLCGLPSLASWYNSAVGTFLAGAVAIGLYPFLGQRLWCRMWCPLAFWMNFWGRWSRFRITPEKGKCIDCNVCNQFCQMGIDIRSHALRGEAVTLETTACVGCGECVVRCPMEILHLGDAPPERLHQLHIPAHLSGQQCA